MIIKMFNFLCRSNSCSNLGGGLNCNRGALHVSLLGLRRLFYSNNYQPMPRAYVLCMCKCPASP